jgi:hypothetical protein
MCCSNQKLSLFKRSCDKNALSFSSFFKESIGNVISDYFLKYRFGQ